jgi:CHASE2 domain-containing sensor protein
MGAGTTPTTTATQHHKPQGTTTTKVRATAAGAHAWTVGASLSGVWVLSVLGGQTQKRQQACEGAGHMQVACMHVYACAVHATLVSARQGWWCSFAKPVGSLAASGPKSSLLAVCVNIQLLTRSSCC